MQTKQIREHMEVVGADEEHVGTVDGVDGGQIKLTKSDPVTGGEHHFIPLAWVDTVDEKVRLSIGRRGGDCRLGNRRVRLNVAGAASTPSRRKVLRFSLAASCVSSCKMYFAPHESATARMRSS
jgi:hypothetical protein